MSTVGVITEYNPFHTGHAFQLRQIRKRMGPDTAVVCAMSGNWVQRGECAVADKWLRASWALAGGADLVLEIPTLWAAAPAEREQPVSLEGLGWTYPRLALAQVPSKLTATQLKGRFLDQEVAEDTEYREASAGFPIRFDRPRFAAEERGLTSAQKGTAFHLAMELVRPEAAATRAGAAAELARLEAAACLTSQQRQAVEAEQVAAFFASELGRQAAAAPDLRREFKFSLLVDAGDWWGPEAAGERAMLQGVIDCCFTGPEGLTVVDFKTDRVSPGGEAARAEEYRGQLEVYTRALESILGRPVVRRVLWFVKTGVPVELKKEIADW